MKQKNEYVDQLKRLIMDHKDISEHLEVLKEVMGFLFKEEAWIKMKPIEDFFRRNVIEHFEFEETIVFPPVLLRIATPDSIKLILVLQREHGAILKELEEFQKIISKTAFPCDNETSTRLNVVARKIIDNLIAHSSKEDDMLLPILEKNRHIFDKHDFI